MRCSRSMPKIEDFFAPHPGYAPAIVVASSTTVVDCPHECLAHLELIGVSGKVEAVAPLDANMCRFLIERLTAALAKVN